MTAAKILAVGRALEMPASSSSMRMVVGPACACENGKGKKPSRAFSPRSKPARMLKEDGKIEPSHWRRLIGHVRTISRGSHEGQQLKRVHRHALGGRKLAAQEQVPVKARHGPTSWPKMARLEKITKTRDPENRTPERFGTAAPYSSGSSQKHTRREKPPTGKAARQDEIPARKRATHGSNTTAICSRDQHMFHSGSGAIKKLGTMKNR